MELKEKTNLPSREAGPLNHLERQKTAAEHVKLRSRCKAVKLHLRMESRLQGLLEIEDTHRP